MTAAFLVLSLIAAAAPVRVAGRVTDPTGAPVAAAIHAATAEGPIVGRSDAGGTFALEADPVPAEGVVVVAAGFAAERVSAATLGAGGSITVVLRPAALTRDRHRHRRPPRAARRRYAGRDDGRLVGRSAQLRRHHRRRCAALHARLHAVPAVLVPRRQPDDAGRHPARALGVRREPHAGARRRRAAQRPVRRLGLLEPRAAGGDRSHRDRARRHQRSLRRRRRRRRDPGRAGRRAAHARPVVARRRLAGHGAGVGLRLDAARRHRHRRRRRAVRDRRRADHRRGGARPDRHAGRRARVVVAGERGVDRDGQRRARDGQRPRPGLRRGPHQRHAAAGQRHQPAPGQPSRQRLRGRRRLAGVRLRVVADLRPVVLRGGAGPGQREPDAAAARAQRSGRRQRRLAAGLGPVDAGRRRRRAARRRDDQRDPLRRRAAAADHARRRRADHGGRLRAGHRAGGAAVDGGRRRARRSHHDGERRVRHGGEPRAPERARIGDVAGDAAVVAARHGLPRLPRAHAQRALPQLPRRRHADPGERGADRGEAHRRRDLGAAGPRAVERAGHLLPHRRSTTPSPTSRCR